MKKITRLYNKDGKEFDTKNFKLYSSEGNTSTIYIKDDIILKVYLDITKDNSTLSRKMFDILKEIDNPNFIKLKDYYFDTTCSNEKTVIKAYTSEKIEQGELNIIDMNTSFFLDSINELEKLCEDFANHHIILKDIRGNNILFNESGPTLIDPDLFYQMKILPKTLISESNKREMLEYIRKYLYKCYDIYYGISTMKKYHEVRSKIDDICDINPNSMASNLSKKIHERKLSLALQTQKKRL